MPSRSAGECRGAIRALLGSPCGRQPVRDGCHAAGASKRVRQGVPSSLASLTWALTPGSPCVRASCDTCAVRNTHKSHFGSRLQPHVRHTWPHPRGEAVTLNLAIIRSPGFAGGASQRQCSMTGLARTSGRVRSRSCTGCWSTWSRCCERRCTRRTAAARCTASRVGSTKRVGACLSQR